MGRIQLIVSVAGLNPHHGLNPRLPKEVSRISLHKCQPPFVSVGDLYGPLPGGAFHFQGEVKRIRANDDPKTKAKQT